MVYYSGPGDRYMSVTWPLQGTGPLEGRNGRSVGAKMCWKGYRSRLGGAGRSEASQAATQAAEQTWEQSDHSPNAVVCHVTVVS